MPPRPVNRSRWRPLGAARALFVYTLGNVQRAGEFLYFQF
jgi:hypothetical protein